MSSPLHHEVDEGGQVFHELVAVGRNQSLSKVEGSQTRGPSSGVLAESLERSGDSLRVDSGSKTRHWRAKSSYVGRLRRRVLVCHFLENSVWVK